MAVEPTYLQLVVAAVCDGLDMVWPVVNLRAANPALPVNDCWSLVAALVARDTPDGLVRRTWPP